jgi:hypothetical protein
MTMDPAVAKTGLGVRATQAGLGVRATQAGLGLQAAPVGEGRISPDSFVGRDEPLAALMHRAELATIGRGSFVVVTGPAGIGKSRLCAELAARLAPTAAADPAAPRVVQVACWTHGGAPPLWPWHEIVRRITATDLPAPSGQPGRFAFFEETVAQLRAAAERRPLVVVLDDVHTADEGTLLATRFVARQLADARILLVVAARPAWPERQDRPAGTPAATDRESTLLAELEQAATVIGLGGLAAHEVGDLVRADGRDGDSPAVGVLCQLTGGNPLAVRSILRAAPPGPLTEALPLGVRESATERLRTVDPASARVLRRAAVLGGRAAVADVAAVCAVAPDAVARARTAGLAIDVLVPSAAGELVFTHELVAEALVGELPDEERLDAHAAAAAVLRAADPSAEGRLRAAHHSLAAASRSTGDRADALVLAGEAAAGLVGAQAFTDADELLSQAVAMAERTGDGTVPATLRRDRAHAVLLAGRVAEAHRHFTEAVAVAADEGDPVVVAETAVGLGGLWVNDVRSPVEQRALLRRLRAALDGLAPGLRGPNAEPGLRGPNGGSGHEGLALRLRARIAAAAVFFEHAPLEPVLDALDEALRWPDATVRLEVISTVHTALLGPDHGELRHRLTEQLVSDAGDVSAGIYPLMARCWRAIDLFVAGDDGASRALAELRAPAEALQCLSVLYIVRCIEVMLTIRSGRLIDAEQAAAATLELGQRAQDADALHFYGAQLLTIRWLQGRDGELVDLVEELADSPDRNGCDGAFDAAAAAVAARAGRLDLARRHLRRLTVERSLADQPRFSTWTVTICAAIEAAAALGDAAVAREAYDLLAPHAGAPVTPSLAVTCFGSARRFLGVAARTFGDLDGAVEHLRAAVDDDVRLGHRPAAAVARADLAETLDRRRAPGDTAEARALFDKAMADGGSMGMGALVERWGERRAAIAPDGVEAEVVVIKPVAAGGWAVELGGERAVLPDRAGMRHLAHLTAAPGAEVPVLELVAAATGSLRVEVGRQPLLDTTARRALEDRARQLAEAIAVARDRGDHRRQAALEDELDAIAATVRRSTRPGGRSRAFTDDAERARTAVRKAILRAIAEIDRALPVAGDHLRTFVTTGTTCRYAPT